MTSSTTITRIILFKGNMLGILFLTHSYSSVFTVPTNYLTAQNLGPSPQTITRVLSHMQKSLKFEFGTLFLEVVVE
jgi:hypothetical protein